MPAKYLSVTEGDVTLRLKLEYGNEPATLTFSNEADALVAGTPTETPLDPTKVFELSVAFARLAAELAAEPPAGARAYVDERDLGRTDHEDEQSPEERRAAAILEEAKAAGMPDACPICSAELKHGRLDGLEAPVYFWECVACCFSGGDRC